MKNKYWIFRSDNYVGVLGIIFAVLVAVLIFLSFKYDKEHCTLWGCDDSVYLQEEMNEVNVKNTYTYTNHGFSIELPTGFTPVEKDWQNGQGTDITMPDGFMIYSKNALDYEKNELVIYNRVTEEKIGDTTFEIYNKNNDDVLTRYWYKKGNVGYWYGGDKSLLETFKFTGWPQMEGDKEDLVSFSIKPGQEVSGKVHATGMLSGAYFFEASVPIAVLDEQKNVIFQTPGTSKEWMTAKPVSFSVDLDFSNAPKGKAYIRITQDDPSGGESGLKIHSILIPIVIK